MFKVYRVKKKHVDICTFNKTSITISELRNG